RITHDIHSVCKIFIALQYSHSSLMTGSAENAFRAVCDKYPEFTAEEIRSILSSKMNESIAVQ
ncbi:MAG: hypothetical protein IJ130_09820, partial [Solobacterium sp.]|nr:hypothetical protein [Solobacterium sp.]